jgi:hypothetical protein
MDPVKDASFGVKPTACRMSDFARFLHDLGTESIIGSNIGKVTSGRSQTPRQRGQAIAKPGFLCRNDSHE